MTTTPSDDDLLADARDFIRAEAAAVASVADDLDADFLKVVQALQACTGKVITSGSGTSGSVARRMAHLLSVCGTPSTFIHPMDALHGTLGVIAPGDVLLAISKGGDTKELTECAVRARTRGAVIVSITATVDSPLARESDVAARVDSPAADPAGIVAMGSTLATSAWGDALALALMRARRYSWSDVLYSHPAGAVGAHADELLRTAPDEDDRSR